MGDYDVTIFAALQNVGAASDTAADHVGSALLAFLYFETLFETFIDLPPARPQADRNI